MDLSSWLTALDAATRATPDGFASRDLRRHLGISADAAGKLLRKWHDCGLIIHVGFRSDTGLDGRSIRVPIYRPTSEVPHGSQEESRDQEAPRKEGRSKAASRPQARRRVRASRG